MFQAARAAGTQAPAETRQDELLVREEFTAPYLRAKVHAAAEALLKADPLSVDAVSLLVRAERYEAALALAERIGQARSELLRLMISDLIAIRDLDLPWKRTGPMTRAARAKVLLEQATTVPRPPAEALARIRADRDPAADGDLYGQPSRFLDAVDESKARAVAELSERGRWSAGDVRRVLEPVHAELRDMARRERGWYRQRALAMLAESEFEARQLREALGHFSELETTYSESEAAWPAAVRVAQLTQAIAGPGPAAEQFARVRAVRPNSNGGQRVLESVHVP